MNAPWNRRSFLASVGAAGVATFCSRSTLAAPQAKVDKPRVISHLKHRYHGWPTLTRRANGELLVVCSGGRETHVCPFGRVELIRSKDEGKTWSDALPIESDLSKTYSYISARVVNDRVLLSYYVESNARGQSLGRR